MGNCISNSPCFAGLSSQPLSRQPGPTPVSQQVAVSPTHASKLVVKSGERSCEVHLPAGCSANSNSEIRVEVLCDEPCEGKIQLFPPLRLNLSDGSQPQKAVGLRLELADDVPLGCAVHAMSWADSDFELGASARGAGKKQTVFLSATNRRSVWFEATHFTTFKVQADSSVKVEFNLADFGCKPNDKFAKTYNDEAENKIEYTRGDEPYNLPAGFTRTAMEDKTEFTDSDLGSWEDCPVGFHGTTMARAKLILGKGFKLPSQGDGVRKGPDIGRIPIGATINGVANWADAIFLSPSHKYAAGYSSRGNDNEKVLVKMASKEGSGKEGDIYINTECVDLNGKVLLVLLQCRIKREGITENSNGISDYGEKTGPRLTFPGTSGRSLDFCDSRIKPDFMEIRVWDPKKVKPYGLLVRLMDMSQIDDYIGSPDWL